MRFILILQVLFLATACQGISERQLRVDCNIPDFAYKAEAGSRTSGEAQEYYGKFIVPTKMRSDFESWALKNQWEPLPIPKEIRSNFVTGTKYVLGGNKGLFFCRSKDSVLQKYLGCRDPNSSYKWEFTIDGVNVSRTRFYYMIVAIYNSDTGEIVAISRNTHS